jgi:hypothetical protein
MLRFARKLQLLLIALILSLTLAGQNTRQFSGIILDSATNTPIPWAHLAIKGSSSGTVSNAEGRFSINLPLNSSSAIIISCIGYKNISMVFGSTEFSDLRIFLEPESKLLSEIVVRPTDVRQLILKAIRKIPYNYPVKPTLITGFYRESLRYDSSNYIYLAEGVLQARKESYLQVEQSGQVKLIKSRKKEFSDSLHTLDKIRFFGGSHAVHTGDFVISRKEFINEKTIMEYDYSISEITHLNGTEVYKISFKPIKSSGLFSGELYLDSESGSFISAKYHLTKTGVKKNKNPLNLFSRLISAERLVHFRYTGNNWMIQNTWGESYWYDKRVNDTIIFQSEFVTTEVDTVDVNSFLYEDKIQYHDIFINKATNLDSTFWDGYAILKENSFIQHLQNKELNAKSTSTDYSESKNSSTKNKNSKSSFIQFIEKTTFDIALTNLFPTYSTSSINLIGQGFSISSSINEPNTTVLGFHSALNFNLKKRLIIGIGFINTFGELGFDNANLAMGYKWQTAIKTRPIKLIAALGFSYNSIHLPIGTVTGPLSIDGKELSDKINVNLQRDFFAFQPSIKVAIEINRRWDFFISANYLFNLDFDYQILFKEQNGFLSKKSGSLQTSDPSIDFRVDGIKTEIVPISINSLFFNTGLTFRYSR